MRRPVVTAAVMMFASVALACSGGGGGVGLEPDVVYFNGHIITGNESWDVVSALAVRDGKIIAVGSDRAIKKLASGNTQLVDFEGKTVVPGFNDNHVHLGGGDFQEWNGGLIGAETPWARGKTTKEELTAALKAHASEVPRGQWIEASINKQDWWNEKIPDKWDLDKAAPNNPVVINRGPHTMILNSMALAKSKITNNIPQPKAGGWFFRDEKGELNGRVLESARRYVREAMPPDPDQRRRTTEEQIEGLRKTLVAMASVGLTSVNVAGVNAEGYGQLQTLYARHGEDLPRATVQMRVSPGTDFSDDEELAVKTAIEQIERLGFHTGFGDDRLKVGALKMSIDGGLSAPNMCTTEPFNETYLGKGAPKFNGVIRITPEGYYRVAKRATELGWQIGPHAIGDSGVIMIVDQMERVFKEVPRADPRFYIHHFTVMPREATLEKIAKNGFMVATQPSFTVTLGSYAEDALTGDKLAKQNPAKSLLDRGIKLSFGSDGSPIGPLFGIYNAVTRMGYKGEVRGSEEAVSVQEAIRLHTLGSAYFTFDEKKKGTLEVGKLADMTVLGENILEVEPMKIKDIPVLQTIVGGKVVYDKGKTAAGASQQ